VKVLARPVVRAAGCRPLHPSALEPFIPQDALESAAIPARQSKKQARRGRFRARRVISVSQIVAKSSEVVPAYSAASRMKT
jgi:hypothetical protein